MRNTRAYDVFGNVALVKFDRKTKANEKKKFAEKIMEETKVKTVLEKVGKFKGRLRKQETRWIAGEKTKEVLYRENGCVFRFNIDKTYFSPRLSNERKEIASMIKKDDEVLVMFAGVGPYPIVIAKNSKAKRVWSNEINKEANKYAEQNIELNRIKGKVIILGGNIQDVATKVNRGLKVNGESVPKKYDVIVMPRPQLKETFLNEAFMLGKKGTTIIYYDFCKDDEKEIIVGRIKEEAKNARKKIKILRVKTAGEIASYKIRIRVDFKII